MSRIVKLYAHAIVCLEIINKTIRLLTTENHSMRNDDNGEHCKKKKKIRKEKSTPIHTHTHIVYSNERGSNLVVGSIHSYIPLTKNLESWYKIENKND